MTSKNIRRATADDVPILTQIRNDAHAKKVAYRDYAWGKDGDGFSENWVRHNVSQTEVYVVEVEGTPVATFSLVLDEDKHWGPQEPIAGYVHGLSVRKDFTGRGLGSFILDWCGDQISALNRSFIRLDCAAHNAKLCTYYESLGFVRVGQYAETKIGGDAWALYEKAANRFRKRPSARLLITVESKSNP